MVLMKLMKMIEDQIKLIIKLTGKLFVYIELVIYIFIYFKGFICYVMKEMYRSKGKEDNVNDIGVWIWKLRKVFVC